MGDGYEIRVRGLLGPLLRVAFNEMSCRAVPSQSTISGQLTPDDLDKLLRRLDESGVELIQLDCART
jgi:hypothetical protein